MGVMTRLLLLLWAGVAVSTAVDLHKRIIRGDPCSDTERLYHVKLIGSNRTHENFCGGSLISDSWILTAAHCWEDGWTLKAVLGVHPRKVFKIKEKPIITQNKTYSNADGKHDIMLLKLPKSTDLPNVTLPDCSSKPSVGDTIQIAGHAATKVLPGGEKGDDEPYQLHCGNTTVSDCTRIKACLKNSPDANTRSFSYQHTFCGKDSWTDVSSGDSGGGVIYTPPGQPPMIYGVISATGNETHACVAHALFMDVCEYIGWINGIINTP